MPFHWLMKIMINGQNFVSVYHEEAEECRYNQIKTPTNILFNIILAVLSFICVIPFIFVIMAGVFRQLVKQSEICLENAADRHNQKDGNNRL